LGIVLLSGASLGQAPAFFNPAVPKTWDDAAIAAVEIPLANPIGSPKHVSSAYYYKIPVRKIYKQYPVYAPGREPAGYMEWLKKQDSVVLWGDAGHKPQLKTEADWIKAGETVFSAPILLKLATVRSRLRTLAVKPGMRKAVFPLRKRELFPSCITLFGKRGRSSWAHFPARCATHV
jgi:hypothetical protein